MFDFMAYKELHTSDSVFPLFEKKKQDLMLVINGTCGFILSMIKFQSQNPNINNCLMNKQYRIQQGDNYARTQRTHSKSRLEE